MLSELWQDHRPARRSVVDNLFPPVRGGHENVLKKRFGAIGNFSLATNFVNRRNVSLLIIGLVIKTGNYFESCRAPIDEMDRSFGLDYGDRSVNVLGYDIASVQ